MRDIFPIWVFLLNGFPFLFGGTFIEGGCELAEAARWVGVFPFLFGGTFIEGPIQASSECLTVGISLPFRRDFH